MGRWTQWPLSGVFCLYDFKRRALCYLKLHTVDSLSAMFGYHLATCVFPFITLVCSFPDVRMDTLALDAYRLSRCGCTCPILSKVCSLSMSGWERRHSWHWITSVDSRCTPLPSYLPLSSPCFSFSGQRAMSCALCTPCTGAAVPSMGTLCFCCL